jgi:quercetin dioxygenase-like cupin family protein
MSISKAVLASLLGGLLLASPAAQAAIDPAAVTITPPDKIPWKGEPGKVQSAVLAGDPDKEGSLYVMLLKWPPHMTSRPHSHEHDRYVTVLQGVWWVNTGARYDPATMVPIKPGSFVVHTAGGIHYDGAKDEGAVIEVTGIGPAKQIPREEK